MRSFVASFQGEFADIELRRNSKSPRLIQLTVLEGWILELTIPESLDFIAKKLPILERSNPLNSAFHRGY